MAETGEEGGGQGCSVVTAVGLGEASATVWTADLSEEYVRLNAQYS